jgi:hypothetical protein
VQAIGGKLELVIDHEDVGWLEMTMDKIPGVEPGKRVENRVQHFSGFGGGQGTLAKNLRKDFFGVFGDDIEEIDAIDSAASGIKDLKEVRMGEGGGGRALSDANFCILCIRRSQLDGGFPGGIGLEFDEEDTALLSSAQPPEKSESPVDGASDTIAGEECGNHGGFHSIDQRRRDCNAKCAEVTAVSHLASIGAGCQRLVRGTELL